MKKSRKTSDNEADIIARDRRLVPLKSKSTVKDPKQSAKKPSVDPVKDGSVAVAFVNR